MTIEEKAKAYDEAYKKVAVRFGSNVADEIFLKESEDERIKKEMIFYFTEEIPQCSIQEHSDKMREFISWLERQEVECTKLELKAGNSYFCYKSRWERADSETFKKGLIYKCNKDGVLDNFVIKNPEQHFIEIKDERIAWLEKQGEQKSAWSEEDESWFKELELMALSFSNDDSYRKKFFDWLKSLEERIQPRKEWSEEDEEIYKKVKTAINSYYAPFSRDAEEMSKWFKSLKDRCLPQQKQEWSEEDEHRREDAIYFLETAKKHYASTSEIELTIDWLKSLRPQKQEQWNEQDIEMIDWLIRCCEKEYEELCNDRYGHQEIVSDLKRDCRKKWDWLESLKSKVVPQKQWKPSDLPHWKKSNLPNDTTTGFNSDYFCHKGYCINYKELFDKLPKDD